MDPAELPRLIEPAMRVMNYAGIGLFATSGALAAADKRLTPVTFAFFALATGMGGGTFRDVLIDAPVFWLVQPAYLAICLIMAGVVWLTPKRWWRPKALDWADAVGLAIFAVYGAAKALDHGVPPLAAVVMGVFTACVGGIIRDILAGEPSIVIRPEIYVTAAVLAAGLFVGLLLLGVPVMAAALIGAGAGFLLRAYAIVTGAGLPTYGG